jgi:phosphatidate phosphatase APP1
MKIKILIATVFVLAISILVSLQAQQIVAAEKTGVSSPLSSPVTYMLTGLVQYGSHGFYRPAPNVKISIARKSSAQIFSVTTDSTGHYSIALVSDYYTLVPSDAYRSQFTPSSVTFLLNSNWNQNFFGIPPLPNVK